MASSKLIRIEFPTNTDGSLTHQVRNFGEDLYREIEVSGFGDLGGLAIVDTATNRLEVRVFRVGSIGRVRRRVQMCIERHLLGDRVRVTFDE